MVENLHRETFWRTLKEKSTTAFKPQPSKKREGDILYIAKSPVVTMAPTTPIYDAIQIMAREGFRRIPIVNPGTKVLKGIITATDIINYLGGGEKFEIIKQRFDGNFFKAMNQPVRLIMTKNVVSVKTNTKISDAIALMKEKNLGGLPVVNDERQVKAIITERDIIHVFADRISNITVSQIMSSKVITALDRTTIFEAEKTMVTYGFRRLPLLSNDKLIGIITVMDIIRFFGSSEIFRHLQSGTIIQVLNTSALSIAQKEVLTVESNKDVGQAAKIMRDKNVGALPVVENQKLVGIITERDFFKLIE